MTTQQNQIYAALENMLENLLARVDRSQEKMSQLDQSDLAAQCLKAMTHSLGSGLALMFCPDRDERLLLTAWSHKPPFATADFGLDPAQVDRTGELPRPARNEMLAASLSNLLRSQYPERDVCVEILEERDHTLAALARLSDPGRTFDEQARENMGLFSGAIRLVLAAADRYRKLLDHTAMDLATGLFNQTYFNSRLKAELSRASRHGHPLSLLCFNLDDFSAYGNAWGREAAVGMLKQVAAMLGPVQGEPGPQFSFRRSDIPARYGNEEFAVILPETPKWGALTKAERLRQAIADLPQPNGAQSGPPLTVSIGVAAFPEDASDAIALMDATAQACSRADEAGKNRVEPA